MTGLDTNILVQLAVADHERNIATLDLFNAEIQRGEYFVVPSLVVTEFLYVVTDQKRFDPPMTQVVALDWVEGFLTQPQVRVFEPDESSLRQTFQLMRQFQLGRKRILDAHLAAMLATQGINRLMTSNRSDFEVFGYFEFVVP